MLYRCEKKSILEGRKEEDQRITFKDLLQYRHSIVRRTTGADVVLGRPKTLRIDCVEVVAFAQVIELCRCVCSSSI